MYVVPHEALPDPAQRMGLDVRALSFIRVVTICTVSVSVSLKRKEAGGTSVQPCVSYVPLSVT